MRLADTDVSPAIIEQLSQEPEEAYWFVWSNVTDMPWYHGFHKAVEAFAFESDAAYIAEKFNGKRSVDGILDGYPRQATVKEAKAARPDNDRPVGLFDRDLNLIKVIG